jgi:hypothetical protein
MRGSLNLKKYFYLFILFLLSANYARAQSITTANLTASGANCPTASPLNALCVPVGVTFGAATFTLEGTWVATVQFEASGDGGGTWVSINVTPSNSTTAVTSATGNGVWQANVAGYTNVRMRVSAFTSGTVIATISTSSASARSGGGGGGGGVTSLNSETGAISILPTSPITVTNGAGTITVACPTCNTSGATIGGSIAATQVAFGSGANTIAGSNNFIYNSTTGTLTFSDTTQTQPQFMVANLPNSVQFFIQQVGIHGVYLSNFTNNTSLFLAPDPAFFTTATIAPQSVLIEYGSSSSGLVLGEGGATGRGGLITLIGSLSGQSAVGVAPAAGTPNPIFLPLTTGTSGQVLSTDGGTPNQQTSWVTPSTTATSVPFSGVTSATNATAAMVVGTGASLNVSGAGTINATSVNSNTFPASAGFTSGGILCFTSTSAAASSTLLQLNSPVIGGGAGACPTTDNTIFMASNAITDSVSTTGMTYQGGIDSSANSALGGIVTRGADETGAGGATSAGGSAIIRGGNNAATNAASMAGSVELIPGLSTGATQGEQGLLAISENYVLGGGTSTLWNLQCIVTTTAMTINDCGASPSQIVGVAMAVNANTVQVHSLASQTPVNASAAVTVGDTVCAGTTAGKVTDSGGTTPCTTGFTVGQVIAVSGTYVLPVSGSVTLSTTLPLIQYTRNGAVGTANGVAFSGITSGTNTTAAMVLGTGSSLTTSGTGTLATTTEFINSANGAASLPAALMNGTVFSGGSASTTFPYLYLNPSANTNPTNFSTGGTMLGINSPTGFTGGLIQAWNNGGSALFIVGNNGQVTSAAGFNGTTSTSSGSVSAKTYLTATNCSQNASPAVCASAAAGVVAVPTGTNPTLTINTTAVTANSRIFLQIDESATIAATTCNSTLSTLVQPVVTARTAGTSFTIQIGAVIATNPACVSYLVFN